MSMSYYTENHPALNKPIPEFRANDLKNAGVTKAQADPDVGLTVTKKGKQFFIQQIRPGGPFDRMHKGYIEEGQRVVQLNGLNVEENFTGMWDVNAYIKKQSELKIHVARR